MSFRIGRACWRMGRSLSTCRILTLHLSRTCRCSASPGKPSWLLNCLLALREPSDLVVLHIPVKKMRRRSLLQVPLLQTQKKKPLRRTKTRWRSHQRRNRRVSPPSEYDLSVTSLESWIYHMSVLFSSRFHRRRNTGERRGRRAERGAEERNGDVILFNFEIFHLLSLLLEDPEGSNTTLQSSFCINQDLSFDSVCSKASRYFPWQIKPFVQSHRPPRYKGRSQRQIRANQSLPREK